MQELKAKLAPLLNETEAIYRRNCADFERPTVRELTSLPAKDSERLADLLLQVERLEDEWDVANPLEPCPICGTPRSALTNGVCVNFGNCPEAPLC